MKIKIKTVQVTDIDKLVEISHQTFVDTFGMQNTAADLKRYLANHFNEIKLKKELANPDSQFYFAESESRVVGYLKINVAAAQTEPDYPHALEIQRIYVVEEYQQLGVGQQLLDWAIKKAVQLKKMAVWLGVWEHNLLAQQFYLQAGFSRTQKHIFTLGNSVQSDWIMTKILEE